MPNIAKILKEEIQRLARKEVKDATTVLRKDNSVLKRTVAEHKRRITGLEKQNRELVSKAEKERNESVLLTDEEAEKARVTPKMLKSIRKKLGISQAEFALLIGVSLGSVASWEQKEGQLQFRDVNTKAAIVEASKLTKAEAQKRLEKKSSAKKKAASKKSKSEKKAPVSKRTARRKTKPGKKASSRKKVKARRKTEKTATNTVLKIIKRYKKGVGISELKKKTRFEDRKIRNILHHITEQGKIKRVGQGIYAGA